MRINFLFLRKWLVSVFNRPYQLMLDKKIEDPLTGQFLYLFRKYGSCDSIKMSYQDMRKNVDMMQSIHPDDMRQIHIDEYQEHLKSRRYRITDYLRGNEYIVANDENSEQHSGEFICQNLDMHTDIEPSDLVKIAYAEGFMKGKKLSNDITNNHSVRVISENGSSAQHKKINNIINLHDHKG
jgi:hypothetical protein